jgi:predicted glutamine amidotransferase
MGAEPTNGDGFGLGWYGGGDGPGVYRSVSPAWADANLRELAAHIESPLFIAHIRAAIGSPVQQTNCHPFRRGRWLFVHNGYIAGFDAIRRDLMFAIEPGQFSDVQGSTDTEVVFHLALTFGLESDPIAALERTVGLIEATASRHGVADAVQGSFGVADGTSLWAVRYATAGRPRSLFATVDVDAMRRLHPGNPRLQVLSPDDRMIVSEPFSDLPGAWQEIPEALAHREPTMAQHVHVAVPDGARRCGRSTACAATSPCCSPLSDNSRYWRGSDSGFASVRTQIFSMGSSPAASPVAAVAHAHRLVEGEHCAQVVDRDVAELGDDGEQIVDLRRCLQGGSSGSPITRRRSRRRRSPSTRSVRRRTAPEGPRTLRSSSSTGKAG